MGLVHFLVFILSPIQTRSRQYNADIQVHAVRYAMLEQLRNPPTGKTGSMNIPYYTVHYYTEQLCNVAQEVDILASSKSLAVVFKCLANLLST